ncbi:hypothetical protein [Pseudanabaena sp. 'Roaring Creek']|nr:hypothetical protein [Pseudanabaena sp. 'Roaring Creek']
MSSSESVVGDRLKLRTQRSLEICHIVNVGKKLLVQILERSQEFD